MVESKASLGSKKKKNTEKIELQIGPGNCANISNGKGWKKRISVKMTQWILKSANRKTWGGGIEVVKKEELPKTEEKKLVDDINLKKPYYFYLWSIWDLKFKFVFFENH